MKYHAFISYSHRDGKWGAWLHRALETYKPPKAVRKNLPIEAPKRLFPIFRDREELPTSANLGDNIRDALQESRFLIVICSPHAAQSRWVNEEIKTFKVMGRADRILGIIVGGEPNATDKEGGNPAEECFPPALRFEVDADGELTDRRVEPVAADARPGKDGKRNSLLKLAAPMFGVGYDTLKRRDDARRKKRRVVLTVSTFSAAVFVAALAWNAYRATLARTRGEARNALRSASQAYESGDVPRALAWLARAIRLDPSFASPRAMAFALLAEFPVLYVRVEGLRYAAFSPDGKRIVTASDDSTAQVWDAQTGLKLGPPLRHNREVRTASFSGDGLRVVTAAGVAQVWDSRSGQKVGRPIRHSGGIESAVFSPDGERVLTTSLLHGAHVWDVRSAREVTPQLDVGRVMVSAEFSPDGERVVTASNDEHGAHVEIWDARSGRTLGSLSVPARVVSAAFSPGGERIVTASHDGVVGDVQVWDVRSGKKLGPPLRHEGRITSAAYSRDGRRILAVATLEGTVQVWDAASMQKLEPPLRHDTWVYEAAFSASGLRIVTASKDNMLRVWRLQPNRQVGPTFRHDSWISTAVFSPDGHRILTVSDEAAQLWDAQTGRPLPIRLRHQGRVSSAAFSADGHRIVTASDDSTAQVWDAVSGSKVIPPLRHSHYVYNAEFSGDGRRIVTASRDRTAQLWDAVSGRKLGLPLQHEDWVFNASFSPDGRRLVTGSDGGIAQVWDVQSMRKLHAPLLHRGGVASATFDRHGRRIITASRDSTAQVWDAESARRLGPPLRHEAWVASAAFSPDGQRIVTASSSKAQLWDAQSGLRLGPPYRYEETSPRDTWIPTSWSRAGWRALPDTLGSVRFVRDAVVNGATFSPDGQRILTGGSDGSARMWDARTAGEADADRLADFIEAAIRARISEDGTFIRDEQTAQVLDRFRAAAQAVRKPVPGSLDEFLWLHFQPD